MELDLPKQISQLETENILLKKKSNLLFQKLTYLDQIIKQLENQHRNAALMNNDGHIQNQLHLSTSSIGPISPDTNSYTVLLVDNNSGATYDVGKVSSPQQLEFNDGSSPPKKKKKKKKRVPKPDVYHGRIYVPVRKPPPTPREKEDLKRLTELRTYQQLLRERKRLQRMKEEKEEMQTKIDTLIEEKQEQKRQIEYERQLAEEERQRLLEEEREKLQKSMEEEMEKQRQEENRRKQEEALRLDMEMQRKAQEDYKRKQEMIKLEYEKRLLEEQRKKLQDMQIQEPELKQNGKVTSIAGSTAESEKELEKKDKGKNKNSTEKKKSVSFVDREVKRESWEADIDKALEDDEIAGKSKVRVSSKPAKEPWEDEMDKAVGSSSDEESSFKRKKGKKNFKMKALEKELDEEDFH